VRQQLHGITNNVEMASSIDNLKSEIFKPGADLRLGTDTEIGAGAEAALNSL
jgi:hypothetical protein